MSEDSEPDLLRNQLRSPSSINQFSQEELSQKGIQWLLLITKLITATSILLLQCAQKPLQNQECALLRIFLCCWRDEDGGVFCPVRGELGERGGGEDEWWGGQRGEIAG